MRKKEGTEHELSVFSELYGRLAQLPTEKLTELLEQILPPQEIFARMEGTLFAMHFRGLSMFNLSAELFEAGIEAGDPRTEIFHQLQGGLVEKCIMDKSRAIAQREDNVCRRAKGIMIWDGGKRCWYVPVAATTEFIEATDKLIAEYAQFKQEKILDRYDELRGRGEEIVQKAADSAWNSLVQTGNNKMPRSAFMDQAAKLFEDRFPTKEIIENGFVASREPRQMNIPEIVRVNLKEIREAERQLIDEQVERERKEGDRAGEQLRLLELEVQMQREKERQLEKENELRERILRDAIAPEVEKAKQIVSQFYASVITVGNEILDAARAGKPIHPGTRGRWTRMIEAMGAMEQTRSMREALDALLATSQQAGKDAIASAQDVKRIEGLVDKALKDMANRVQIESNAAGLWELVRANKAESRLKEITKMRDTLQKEDAELEALLDLMTVRE
jgi:hypothetical protein